MISYRICSFVHHRTCYSTFTNNVHIKRAQERCHCKKENRKEVDLSPFVGDKTELQGGIRVHHAEDLRRRV